MSTVPHVNLRVTLHTDNDFSVWYSDNFIQGENTHSDITDFFNSDYMEQLDCAATISVLGIRNNAGLITQLYERQLTKQKYRNKRLFVRSPAAIPRKTLNDNIPVVLQRLRQPLASDCRAHQSHDIRPNDYITYSMIGSVLLDNTSTVPEKAKRFLRQHPAFPAIDFVSSSNLDSACALICDIVDPRWFRHATHTSRQSNLYSYLGLTLQNMRCFCGETSNSESGFNRAVRAMKAWYNSNFDPDNTAAGNFLSATFKKHTHKAKALLRCTQRFVSLLSHVWFAGVTNPHVEACFDSKRFFQDPEISRVFDAHRLAFKPI